MMLKASTVGSYKQNHCASQIQCQKSRTESEKARKQPMEETGPGRYEEEMSCCRGLDARTDSAGQTLPEESCRLYRVSNRKGVAM